MKYLKKLVSIKSDENCDEILNYLKSELMHRVKELKILGEEEKILIAGLNTKLNNIEPVILSGHIDTVRPNMQLYNTNPYELTIINNKGYGLGSIDMKSFVAVILQRLDELNNFDIPIVLALTTDEETKLNSIKLMIDYFKEMNIKPKFTIVGEPTNNEICLSSSACFEYSIMFYGKSAHSSKISEGINSICACAKMISFIEQTQKKYRLSSNCGVVNGGEVVNKVPDFTELLFDVRSIYAYDINSFINDINRFINKLLVEYNGISIDLKNKLTIPVFNMKDNEKLLNISKKLKIQIGTFSGGCEAGYYANYCGDCIIFGVGDLSLAHKPNEFVDVNEYGIYSNKLLEVLNCIKENYF